MNILDTNRKGGPYESIDQYMNKALTSNTCELEWIYGSHPRNSLNKTEFLRILNPTPRIRCRIYCTCHTKYKPKYKILVTVTLLQNSTWYIQRMYHGILVLMCSMCETVVHFEMLFFKM